MNLQVAGLYYWVLGAHVIVTIPLHTCRYALVSYVQMVEFSDCEGCGEAPQRISIEQAVEKVILALLSPAIHGVQSIGIKSAARRAEELPPPAPELKGSIGEGPNHSNFSDPEFGQNSCKTQEYSPEN